MEIHYKVIGIPKPHARPRFVSMGKFTKAYQPKTDWFSLVYGETLKIKNSLKNRLMGALELNLTFYMPIPKSISKKKRATLKYVTKKPDLDNLAKAVMDAINNASIWEDDSQVSVLNVSKIYSDEPGCSILVREVE